MQVSFLNIDQHLTLCSLFGHFVSFSPGRECRCGIKILQTDGTQTRIRHVVSCFLAGHQYSFVQTRNEHDEFSCSKCGHPLLFRIDRNAHPHDQPFVKKVRYLCNLFGHQVHAVTGRNGFFEYACNCGHTFVKKQIALKHIKHPVICLFAGHFVRLLCQRSGLDEFYCRNCGHTFLQNR